MHYNSCIAVLVFLKLCITNVEAETFFKDLRDLCFECDCDLHRLLTESKTQVYFNNVSIVCDKTFKGKSQDAGFSTERKYVSQQIDDLVKKNIVINNIDLHVKNAYFVSTMDNLMKMLKPEIQIRKISLALNMILTVPKKIFMNRSTLEEVDLSGNMIHSVESVDFRGLKELKRIYLNRSHVQNFNFDGFEDSKSLEEVNLSENSIKNVNCQNSTLSHLISLDFFWNSLSDSTFKTITICLSKFPQLRYLNLSWNNIIAVGEDSFKSLRELRLLNLAGNELLNVSFHSLKDLKNLEQLFLQFNSIDMDICEFPDGFYGSNSYKYSIENMETLGMDSLVSLNISHNKIENIKCLLDFSPKLQELDVSWNYIRSVNSSGTFKSLRRLILDRNPLDYAKLDLSDFVSLEYLSLSQVKEFEVFHFTKIAGIFTNQSSTKCSTLIMSHNPNLRAIVGNFSGTNICKFDLSFNKLTFFHKNVFNWNTVKWINLQGNPLMCRCEQKWMFDDLVPLLMREDPSLLMGLRCDEPKSYKEERLVNLYNRSDYCAPFKALGVSDSDVGKTRENSEIILKYGIFLAFGIFVAIMTVMLAITYVLLKIHDIRTIKEQWERNVRYSPSSGGVIQPINDQ